MPVEIRNRLAPPAAGLPAEVDTLFVAGFMADPGGLAVDKATVVRSIGDYTNAGGDRAKGPIVYDGLDNYFREGGGIAYVAPYAAAGDPSDALDLFTEELGGGNVVAWGDDPTSNLSGALTAWADSTHRFVLGDVPQIADTYTELLAAADTVAPVALPDLYASFGPWVEIPPMPGVVGGGTRQAPATSTVAGLISRSDSLGNPNRAPAGRDFPLQNAVGLVGDITMTDTQAAALRDAGLNPLRRKLGLYVLDGFQTPIVVDPNTPFWQANCGRARMWLQWRAAIVGYNYEYKPIDGRGRLLNHLASDLAGVCRDLYDVDGLYGNTPSDAFSVSTSVAVNTDDEIATGQITAVVEARFSMHARKVIIELVSVPITGTVS